eukprot:scaffold5793_cov417-Prasinococcus_capsulatus_cf.AAC.7
MPFAGVTASSPRGIAEVWFTGRYADGGGAARSSAPPVSCVGRAQASQAFAVGRPQVHLRLVVGPGRRRARPRRRPLAGPRARRR